MEYFLDKILYNFEYALIADDFAVNSVSHDVKYAGFQNIDLAENPFSFGKSLEVLLDYLAHSIMKRVYLYTNTDLKLLK